MDENQIPEEVISSDVEKTAGKNLAELSEMFKDLKEAADSMIRNKEADSIKTAFYKLLNHLKEEASSAGEDALAKLDEVEEGFKGMYAEYKKLRADYNREQDEIKAHNLVLKQTVIEDLKALVDSQEEVNFEAFRGIQDRWREIGPVPATNFRDINDTYHLYVEKFYDIVKINRDLRDLDFKKNLEVKEKFCEAAEKLAEDENIVSAFGELQKLHEQWKEYGPVAKEFREDIWNRFKAATAVINKKYQEYFEAQKAQMASNLEAKTRLCEQLEEIAGADVNGSGEWNSLSKKIEELQAEWKKIGFATKKDNQKIYDRFRAACDKFFERKREFYNEFKDEMEANMGKKRDIIEKLRSIKDSKEWKSATEQIIALQKEWKEIGAVPRKKSEELWTEFRGLCDEFFAERDKNAAPENNFRFNLKAKKQLIEEIREYAVSDSETANADAMRTFSERWNAIGHVPFKDKEKIMQAYTAAMSEKFPLFASRGKRQDREQGRRPQSPKDALIAKYKALQQDIATSENNLGFFSSSKNSAFIQQLQERIDSAKAELKELEDKIRKAEEGEEEK